MKARRRRTSWLKTHGRAVWYSLTAWHIRKPPRCRVELLITVNGRELVCTTSDHLYYLTKWGGGGAARNGAWLDLLNGDGLMVAASIQSSGSFGVYVRAVEQ